MACCNVKHGFSQYKTWHIEVRNAVFSGAFDGCRGMKRRPFTGVNGLMYGTGERKCLADRILGVTQKDAFMEPLGRLFADN